MILHNTIYRFIKNLKIIFDVGIFIGGEMYIYGKILNIFTNNKIYLSDYPSIVLDAKINDNKYNNSIYHLIDYKQNNCLLNKINNKYKKYFMICNVSKNGLNKNLCEQINILKIKYLLLIECSEKSLDRDIKLLISYKVLYNFIYFTNYKLILTILKIKK
jgi:hypothetical protein